MITFTDMIQTLCADANIKAYKTLVEGDGTKNQYLIIKCNDSTFLPTTKIEVVRSIDYTKNITNGILIYSGVDYVIAERESLFVTYDIPCYLSNGDIILGLNKLQLSEVYKELVSNLLQDNADMVLYYTDPIGNLPPFVDISNGSTHTKFTFIFESLEVSKVLFGDKYRLVEVPSSRLNKGATFWLSLSLEETIQNKETLQNAIVLSKLDGKGVRVEVSHRYDDDITILNEIFDTDFFSGYGAL